MNTLHTESSMVTRYCAPPTINPEPQIMTVLSRCHTYDGPEWEPEPDSVNGYLLRNGGTMVGLEVKATRVRVHHIRSNKSCPALMQSAKQSRTSFECTREQFARLHRSERCKHCQNSIVE